MQEPYEQGVANHSAPSFAVNTARCALKLVQMGWGRLPYVLLRRTIFNLTFCAYTERRCFQSSLEVESSHHQTVQ